MGATTNEAHSPPADLGLATQATFGRADGAACLVAPLSRGGRVSPIAGSTERGRGPRLAPDETLLAPRCSAIAGHLRGQFLPCRPLPRLPLSLGFTSSFNIRYASGALVLKGLLKKPHLLLEKQHFALPDSVPPAHLSGQSTLEKRRGPRALPPTKQGQAPSTPRRKNRAKLNEDARKKPHSPQESIRAVRTNRKRVSISEPGRLPPNCPARPGTRRKGGIITCLRFSRLRTPPSWRDSGSKPRLGK